MDGIKNYFSDFFNLDKKKQPYSSAQILGMIAIVLFLFPVIFNIFGFLSIPFAYMIEFIFEPRNHTAVMYAKMTIAVVRILFGLVSGIWICILVWPKRKVIVEEAVRGGDTVSNIIS
jgi:hypothetical protein